MELHWSRTGSGTALDLELHWIWSCVSGAALDLELRWSWNCAGTALDLELR